MGIEKTLFLFFIVLFFGYRHYAQLVFCSASRLQAVGEGRRIGFSGCGSSGGRFSARHCPFFMPHTYTAPSFRQRCSQLNISCAAAKLSCCAAGATTTFISTRLLVYFLPGFSIGGRIFSTVHVILSASARTSHRHTAPRASSCLFIA